MRTHGTGILRRASLRYEITKKKDEYDECHSEDRDHDQPFDQAIFRLSTNKAF